MEKATREKKPLSAEKLARLRGLGLTLQAIADLHGVSREAVRQMLERRYGTTAYEDFGSGGSRNATMVARQLRHSLKTVRSKLLKVGISPSRHKGAWTPEAIGLLTEMMVCIVCGKPLPAHRSKYCGEECAVAARKQDKHRQYLARKHKG